MRVVLAHVRDRVDVTIYRDPGAYVAHPCVSLKACSRDGGQTWITPRVAPDYDMTSVECPNVTQLSSGVVQWRFVWWPLETARKLWQSSRPYALTR